MPKTIDYPRTTYQSAWEVAEVVDDTGGKCSFETCARKLNRKVSGSFKAIVGSAVKFGLLTSKRELLTTTNLFRRIKHAYDKNEELLYHREAFLHPPLFNQICRKFRNRELPVHMFDIMLIREFGVEEINAQNVAKSFVDGARMAGILDERNQIADIDALASQQGPRRELAAGEMPLNLFKGNSRDTTTQPTPLVAAGTSPVTSAAQNSAGSTASAVPAPSASISREHAVVPRMPSAIAAAITEDEDPDPVSALFGLEDRRSGISSDALPGTTPSPALPSRPAPLPESASDSAAPIPLPHPASAEPAPPSMPAPAAAPTGFLIRISGPGLDTQLHIQDTDDLDIARILLEKIRKQLTA